jgi:hypothetical protein
MARGTGLAYLRAAYIVFMQIIGFYPSILACNIYTRQKCYEINLNHQKFSFLHPCGRGTEHFAGVLAPDGNLEWQAQVVLHRAQHWADNAHY